VAAEDVLRGLHVQKKTQHRKRRLRERSILGRYCAGLVQLQDEQRGSVTLEIPKREEIALENWPQSDRAE
jgi:hypothetical protein